MENDSSPFMFNFTGKKQSKEIQPTKQFIFGGLVIRMNSKRKKIFYI